MATVNRIRGPTPIRPGLMLQRPWMPPRIIQSPSNRSPYLIYRNAPHRYAIKHVGPTRSIFSSPWKTTARLPPLTAATPEYEFVRPASTSAPTNEYEFVRAASPAPVIRTDGAIHTIPAPNLSLSEKPIVVVDDPDVNMSAATEATKPVYEVTEKYPESSTYDLSARIEPPIGFSKSTNLNPAEIQNINHNVALQLASEYGLSAMALPQPLIVPQQFSLQGYNRMPTHQDLLHTKTDGIIIPPNALYQPDPMFLQKLQTHLLQQYPSIEFIPYSAGFHPQIPSENQPPEQNNLFLLENEQIVKQPPSSFALNNQEIHRNLVQRETQESTIQSLQPQGFSGGNNTNTSVDGATTLPSPTTAIVTTETTHSPTTTISHVIEAITENQKTAPIYYAQIGQKVDNVIANGFYSALNDVRAAATLAQVDKVQELPKAQPFNTTSTSTTTTTTTTTLKPDIKAYFLQNFDKNEKNQTIGDLKPLLGTPFEKPVESVNVAYTLLRADKDKQETAKDGVVYAGQLVEAKISEDQDFNKEKANIFAKRPPLRLYAIPDKRTETSQKAGIAKAKIPPKSKLTFDDKTGEPILRIYASYLDSPLQKERLISKLANMKYINEAVTRKQDSFGAMKISNKTQSSESGQDTQFGQRIQSRSDDYVPLFDDYAE